LRAQSRRT